MSANRYPLVPDPEPHRVKTLLFATPPVDYVADTAEEWAAKGFGGFLRPDIMPGWDVDVWALADGTRVVGEENPRLRSCRRMNNRLRAAGAGETFICVPFHKHLPDWFDDGAWARVVGSFRQGARFARMAGFVGMALDDEYIEESLGLEWAPYRASGRSNEELCAQARRRGREIQEGMLAEFLEIVTLHLPESWSIMGDLAKQLFLGYLDALVVADAPGGMHVLPECTYFQTAADWIARYGYGLDRVLLENLEPKQADYWARRCGVALGLAPLGYLRFIRDADGKRLGYGGRKEVFGDRILQPGEDKSGNYPPETFAATHAAARMTSRRYVWVFACGPVWWRMTPEQRARYGGPAISTLPLADDFDDYVETLRTPKLIDLPAFRAMERGMRRRMVGLCNTKLDVLDGLGMPRVWWVVGAFPNPGGAGYHQPYPPERDVDLRAEYAGVTGPVRWRRVETPPMGYVDLSRLIAGGVEIQGYAATRFELSEPTEAVIRFGCDDTGKIWLNGRLIHASNTERIAMPDEDAIPVRLPAGRSLFLLKIGNYRGGWGFYFRITDEGGAEIPAVEWVTQA